MSHDRRDPHALRARLASVFGPELVAVSLIFAVAIIVLSLVVLGSATASGSSDPASPMSAAVTWLAP